MGKALYMLAGLLTCLCGISHRLRAQTPCLPYETLLAKKAALDSTYRSIQEVFDPGYRSRPKPANGVSVFSEASRPERRIRLVQADFQAQINQQLLGLSFLLNKVKGVELFVYVNPAGSIDYAAYNLAKHTLNGFEQEQVHQAFCHFFATCTVKPAGKSPFRIYSSFSLTGLTLLDKQAQLDRFIPNRGPSSGEIRSIERLATSRPDTVTTITLQQIELAEVPRILLRFKNLHHLNLNDNELTRIPRFVFRLKNLSTLNLSGNRLVASAIRCQRNRHIKRINLQFNQLTSLPKRLPKNRHLESLWIGHNDLSAGINPRVLSRLKSVTDLNLYRARLTSLPASIGQLTNLVTLDLYYNHLRALPAQIGTNRHLQQLALAYNQLGTLPGEITKLVHLKALYLRGNSLTSLPDHMDALTALQVLDLSDNAFAEIPGSIINLASNSLEEVNLSENRIDSFPALFLTSNRLKLLDIGANPATSKGKIAELLPLIHQAQDRRIQVRY